MIICHIQVGLTQACNIRVSGTNAALKTKQNMKTKTTSQNPWPETITYYFSECYGLAGLVLRASLTWLSSAGSSAWGGKPKMTSLTHLESHLGCLGLSFHEVYHPGLFHV